MHGWPNDLGHNLQALLAACTLKKIEALTFYMFHPFSSPRQLLCIHLDLAVSVIHTDAPAGFRSLSSPGEWSDYLQHRAVGCNMRLCCLRDPRRRELLGSFCPPRTHMQPWLSAHPEAQQPHANSSPGFCTAAGGRSEHQRFRGLTQVGSVSLLE